MNALEGAQAESPSKNTHKVKSNCQKLPFSCTPHYSSCPQTDSHSWVHLMVTCDEVLVTRDEVLLTSRLHS